VKLFENRFDSEYQSYLLDKLAIDNLLKSSIVMNSPREFRGKSYDRVCRIDFMGLAATTFLDISGTYNPDETIPKQFRNIFDNLSILNEQGIFVKVRFLYTYPFSSSFMSIIQAESSIQRSSIEEPSFSRKFRILDEVDDDKFLGSTTVRNLKNSLELIQEFIGAYELYEDNPNTMRIRFTPVGVNLCLMLLNHLAFYDPYLFSKENRLSKKLSLSAPVVMVSRAENPEIFLHLEDHFRYLWDLDTTLVCEDATHYDRSNSNSLSRFVPPSQTNYDHKAERLEEISFRAGETVSEQQVRSWKFKVNHILNRLSFDTKITPNIESVFVACGWEERDDGTSKPNSYAGQLLEWLDNDFGQSSDTPLLSVRIVKAISGDSLASQIYAHLEEATLGIVILTKDIESKDGAYYTKPNVYHELGFLMKQLEPGRAVVLRENNVIVPSNISDSVYIGFSAQKLILCYREIVLWLNKNCALTNTDVIIEILQRHKKRVENYIIEKQLTQKEGAEARRRIGEDIKEISSR